MVGNQAIHGAILAIMESMRLQGTSPGRLKNFQNAYNVFERYLSDNYISKIDENICLEYVSAKTGQRFDRFECVTSSARVNYRMRPLLLLLRYLQYGQFHSDVRKTKPFFVCPACFKSEYETFCEEYQMSITLSGSRQLPCPVSLLLCFSFFPPDFFHFYWSLLPRFTITTRLIMSC